MNHNLKNPKVSVVIPTYNRAHLIGRAIKSVLNQTYQDFEIIIVDDGSTDNTEEVVKSFNDERIRYIQHKKSRGSAATRNTGIKASKGKYIAFQDSDDEWLLGKLQKQMEIFKNAEKKVGVVYTGFWRIENGKKIYIPSFKVKQKKGDIHKEILKGNFISPQTTVVKKECFHVSGMFDEQLVSRHDWELWIRISKKWHFEFIDEPLVNVYRTPDSISVTQKVALTGWKPVLEKHYEEFKKDRKLLARYLYSIGDLLCQIGEIDQGRDYLLRALRSYPLNPKYLIAAFTSMSGSKVYNKVVKVKRLVMPSGMQ